MTSVKKEKSGSSLHRGALSIMDVMARRSAGEVTLESAHRSTSPLLPPDMKQIFEELPKVRSRSKVNKASSMEPPSSMEPRAIASRLSKATEAMWTSLGTIAADMEESERKLGCNLEYVVESTSTVLSQLSAIIAQTSDNGQSENKKKSSKKSTNADSSKHNDTEHMVQMTDDSLWNDEVVPAVLSATEVAETQGKKKASSLDSRPLKRPRKLEINTGKTSKKTEHSAPDNEKKDFPAPRPRRNGLAVNTDFGAPKLGRNSSTNSLQGWAGESFENIDMAWMDNGSSWHGGFRKASPSEEEPATPDIIDAITGTFSNHAGGGGGGEGSGPLSKREHSRSSEKSSTQQNGMHSDEEEDSGSDDELDAGSEDDDELDNFEGGFGDTDDEYSNSGNFPADNGLAVAKKTRSLSVLCFSRALLFNPNNVPALISLGREAMRKRQWRLGAERLRKAIITDTGSVTGGGNSSKAKGKGSSSGSKNGGAEAPLIRTDQSSSIIDSSVWRDLGMCLLKLNDLDGSTAAYGSALSFYTTKPHTAPEDEPQSSSSTPVESSSPPIYISLMSSIKHLANSWHLDSFPDDAELWFGIGLLQARRGDVHVASEALRASILLDPDGDHICASRLKLACLLKHSRDLEGATQALQAFQTALDNRNCSCRITGVAGSSPMHGKKSNDNPNSALVSLGVPEIRWIDEALSDDACSNGQTPVSHVDATSSCCSNCKGKHDTYGWSDNCGCTGELRRQLLIELGHVLEIKGDWAGARQSYEAALLPCSPSNYITSLPQVSSSTTTSTTLDSISIAQCDSSPLLQQLGWLLHTQFNDLKRATEMLVKATSLPQGTKDWRGWFLLGRLYMAHGDEPGGHPRYHEAYRAFETAVHIDPLNPKIWTSLGILFSRLHQYHDAVDAHGRALRIDPSQYHEWGNIGSLYDLKGQAKDALEAYDIGLNFTEQAAAVKQATSKAIDFHKTSLEKKGAPHGVSSSVPSEVEKSLSLEIIASKLRKRIGEIKADMTSSSNS